MRPATRPPHPELEPNPAATGLDRAWAATRPEAPSSELLDALWAHASAELDRLAVAPAPARPVALASVRPRGWLRTGSKLAAAATLLLAAGLTLRHLAETPSQPDGPPLGIAIRTVPAPAVVADLLRPRPPVDSTPDPAVAAAPGSRPIIDVGVDQTLVVTIDADGPRVDLRPQGEPLVASTTLAEGTARDVFNALESCATP